MEAEMFDSAIRSSGDLAGVFEYDGSVGYFYLYETGGSEGQKVAAAVQVLSSAPDFGESDLAVRWDSAERLVGLLIRGAAWAAFDAVTRTSYGGNYRVGGEPALPAAIRSALLDVS